MTELEADRKALEHRRRRRTRVARLESDLAYFQARLEFIGEPGSANQRAQMKAFKLLHQQLGSKLLSAKAPRAS